MEGGAGRATAGAWQRSQPRRSHATPKNPTPRRAGCRSGCPLWPRAPLCHQPSATSPMQPGPLKPVARDSDRAHRRTHTHPRSRLHLHRHRSRHHRLRSLRPHSLDRLHRNRCRRSHRRPRASGRRTYERAPKTKGDIHRGMHSRRGGTVGAGAGAAAAAAAVAAARRRRRPSSPAPHRHRRPMAPTPKAPGWVTVLAAVWRLRARRPCSQCCAPIRYLWWRSCAQVAACFSLGCSM